MAAEDRVSKLGLRLPKPSLNRPSIVPAVRSGDLVFLSGHGPATGGASTHEASKVGSALSVDAGYRAAREAGLALLGTLRAEIGSLDVVTRIVKVLGMVNCAPGFIETSRVIDGCSDLLVEVFGAEIGRHARSAVGVAELPRNYPVEIEMIVEVSRADKVGP